MAWQATFVVCATLQLAPFYPQKMGSDQTALHGIAKRLEGEREEPNSSSMVCRSLDHANTTRAIG
jgi:hypothetical protein